MMQGRLRLRLTLVHHQHSRLHRDEVPLQYEEWCARDVGYHDHRLSLDQIQGES